MEIWSAHTVLFILVVEGIGTGLIVNGEVYAESRLGVGGFGHLPIDPDGPRCSCGNVGCWEALASDVATLDRFHRACPDNAEKVASLHDLINLAQTGNECARRELLTTASLIGRVIRGLAHGIAPDTIVIGGQIAKAWAMIEPALKQEMHSQYFVDGVSQPTLRPASVENPSLFGAIPVALRSVLQRRRSVQKQA
jgi:predicted NBD/HSP70 family sugar kinase